MTLDDIKASIETRRSVIASEQKQIEKLIEQLETQLGAVEDADSALESAIEFLTEAKEHIGND